MRVFAVVLVSLALLLSVFSVFGGYFRVLSSYSSSGSTIASLQKNPAAKISAALS